MSVDVDRIEQVFEYSFMSPTLSLDASPPQRADVRELQERIRSLESTHADYPVFPVAPGLESLFPHGGLRRGVVYDIDSSPSLLWALIAEATSSGTWCALVGMPDAGLAAAEGMGVNLDRLVLVPRPGEQWLSVVSALIDVVGIVALGPSACSRYTGNSRSVAMRSAARERSCGVSTPIVGWLISSMRTGRPA